MEHLSTVYLKMTETLARTSVMNLTSRYCRMLRSSSTGRSVSPTPPLGPAAAEAATRYMMSFQRLEQDRTGELHREAIFGTSEIYVYNKYLQFTS